MTEAPLKISGIERDTILAALRFWQSNGHERSASQEIHDIATNCGAHELMSRNDITDLAERINA